MKTRFIFVRHAMSRAKELGIVQGAGLDISLTEEGERQAEILAESLRGEKFDRIFTSTALRATQTAKSIRLLNQTIPYQELKELHERSKGVAEGMKREEFVRSYPGIIQSWERGEDARPPNGENFADVYTRVIPLVERHLEKYRGSNLLYVVHGNVIRVLLGHMLGLSFEQQGRLEQDYCAINIIDYDHNLNRWEKICVNRKP